MAAEYDLTWDHNRARTFLQRIESELEATMLAAACALLDREFQAEQKKGIN